MRAAIGQVAHWLVALVWQATNGKQSALSLRPNGGYFRSGADATHRDANKRASARVE